MPCPWSLNLGDRGDSTDGRCWEGIEKMEFPNEHLAGIDCGVPMRFDSTELDFVEVGRFAAVRLETERYLSGLGLLSRILSTSRSE